MLKKEPKKAKLTRPDLDKQKQKEILARRELAKKSKLPKGIFENTGGSDSRLKSSSQMISDMRRRLDLYEDRKSKK